MHQCLTRKDNTFYFRQSVPQELCPIIGKREIKKSLGHDYVRAISECKRYAVVADLLIAEARIKLDSIPVDPYSQEGIRRTRHVPLTQFTPEFEAEFANFVRESLLDTDRRTRITGMEAAEFEAYGQHIEASRGALRRQLAMGHVEPMLDSARLVLIGRGYAPRFSPEDWRRIAYAMTQANLEAYEAMAARQTGVVVKTNAEAILASQFEIQNAPKPVAIPTPVAVIWQNLYDVWQAECVRPESTCNAYRAAMNLFTRFCNKAPQQVTREDVLAFRDFLAAGYEGKRPPAAATVANKIGFVGTLVNSGRNHTKYASHLPHNPFENIKVKRAQRGKAGEKRLPFSDTDLKVLFTSDIYTQRVRPLGGGGEAAAWIPALAYLTGMRLEEIAVLRTRQFQTDAQGNPYIHIEDGKNDNSADRNVPIHPALIEAGLLDYVQSCSDRLFHKVKCSNETQSKAYSQWWGRYLDKLGITAKSKVFHSFRHLFKDLCRNIGLDDSTIDQICGHEPGTVGGKYGFGRRIDILASLIAKIVPPVALPRITPPKIV